MGKPWPQRSLIRIGRKKRSFERDGVGSPNSSPEGGDYGDGANYKGNT